MEFTHCNLQEPFLPLREPSLDLDMTPTNVEHMFRSSNVTLKLIEKEADIRGTESIPRTRPDPSITSMTFWTNYPEVTITRRRTYFFLPLGLPPFYRFCGTSRARTRGQKNPNRNHGERATVSKFWVVEAKFPESR